MLYRLLSGLNALLEHANLWTPLGLDRLVALVWVTPRMHKIHHSDVPRETDSNYGNLFAVFDRLLGTFTPVDRATAITYGIKDIAPIRSRQLSSNLALRLKPAADI